MIQLTARYLGFRNFLFCHLKRKNYNIRNKTLPPASYVYETWFLPLTNKSTIQSVWKQVTRKLLQPKTEKVLRGRRKLYGDQLRNLWLSSDPSTMIKWKRQTIYVKHKVVARSRNHCCRGKETYITYCECVFVALDTQHEKKQTSYYIIICGLCPALPYFSTLSHKRHDFWGEKVIKHKMCILITSTTFVWNISHSKKNSPRYYQKFTHVVT
jgi:hypothetical protein